MPGPKGISRIYGNSRDIYIAENLAVLLEQWVNSEYGTTLKYKGFLYDTRSHISLFDDDTNNLSGCIQAAASRNRQIPLHRTCNRVDGTAQARTHDAWSKCSLLVGNLGFNIIADRRSSFVYHTNEDFRPVAFSASRAMGEGVRDNPQI
ncbi:uncharacterized protein EDB91DRAFT_814525 [Suillus paluster]|uniref:uncharacterized protein n=1 Tax=Suillus paluster TaxID=48578 RepID=UPI001B875278|nr:uncharacterized protein EDB91DRAFT_814525 [Suillus paluster]KAG1729338.1 hypothetical protein EDB91DRAFT_814525 [Suillus paluster]